MLLTFSAEPVSVPSADPAAGAAWEGEIDALAEPFAGSIFLSSPSSSAREGCLLHSSKNRFRSSRLAPFAGLLAQAHGIMFSCQERLLFSPSRLAELVKGAAGFFMGFRVGTAGLPFVGRFFLFIFLLGTTAPRLRIELGPRLGLSIPPGFRGRPSENIESR